MRNKEGMSSTAVMYLPLSVLLASLEWPQANAEKVPIISLFSGQEFISYNLSRHGDSIIGSQEVIDLSFKTRQPNGFLFLSEDGSDQLFIGLHNGFPFIEISIGLSYQQIQFGDSLRVDDDQWHQVKLTRDAREVKAEVDGQYGERRTLIGSFSYLSNRFLYIAGNGNPTQRASKTFSSFVGCVKHVTYNLDNVNLDLLALAKEESMLMQKHGNIIFDQCQGQTQARTASFPTHGSYLTVARWAAQPSGHFSFSFTTMEPYGLLLYQSRTQSRRDMLALEIADGMLFLLIDLGSGVTKIRVSGEQQPLNDGQEHSISLQHAGRSGVVQLDRIQRQYAADSASVGDGQLDSDPPVRLTTSFVNQTGHVTLPTLAAYPTLSIFFQFRSTAKSGLLFYNGGRSGDMVVLELANGAMRAVFRKGSGTNGSTIVIVESQQGLDDGRWHDVSVNSKNGGSHTMQVDWKGWIRCNATCGTLSAVAVQPVTYDLSGPLYIGGTPAALASRMPAPLAMSSSHGFIGCLGSIDINGARPNLVADGNSNTLVHIQSGCTAFDTLCTESTCRHGGVCSHRRNSGNPCDCDLTSFIGPTCSEDSITYFFGGVRGGAISYSIAPDRRRDTQDDALAFGFLSHVNNSILFRATSGNSRDFIEMKIKDGFLYVVYNIGTVDHPVTDALHSVGDKRYHVVRFERRGPNATLQLDNWRPVKASTADNLNVFNNIAHVTIGGRLDADYQAVMQPFKGLISGLVFNKQRLLDMARDSNDSVQFIGDVRLADLKSSKFPYVAAWRPEDTDRHSSSDLVQAASEKSCITSVAISSCATASFDNFSGNDNLITPTFIFMRPNSAANVMLPNSPGMPTNPPTKEVKTSQLGGNQEPNSQPSLVSLDHSSLLLTLATTPHLNKSDSLLIRKGLEAAQDIEANMPFDISMNIPLVGGISGAALLTLLLIIIVACKLTRKEAGAYKVKESATVDEDMQNDISHKIQPTSTPNNAKRGSAPHTHGGNSSGSSKNIKEWYV